MTTMQHALKQVIASWDAPTQGGVLPTKTDETPQMTHTTAPREYHFKPTNRVTEITFDTVKNNPGKTRGEIIAILDAQGYKHSSTSSLLSMMVASGLVAQHQTTKQMHALTDTYRPLKKMPKAMKVGLKKGPKPKGVVNVEVMREFHSTVPVPTAQPVSVLSYTAEDIMQRITMSEGKKLFRLLSEVFA